jgi:hypothetical protein
MITKFNEVLAPINTHIINGTASGSCRGTSLEYNISDNTWNLLYFYKSNYLRYWDISKNNANSSEWSNYVDTNMYGWTLLFDLLENEFYGPLCSNYNTNLRVFEGLTITNDGYVNNFYMGPNTNPYYEIVRTSYSDGWDGIFTYKTKATYKARVKSSVGTAMINHYTDIANRLTNINSALNTKVTDISKITTYDLTRARSCHNNNNTYLTNIKTRAEITNNSPDWVQITEASYPEKWTKGATLANNTITSNITNYKSKLPTKYPDSETK